MRSLVYAFDRSLESSLAACAAPAVGLLAERVFGFTGAVSQVRWLGREAWGLSGRRGRRQGGSGLREARALREALREAWGWVMVGKGRRWGGEALRHAVGLLAERVFGFTGAVSQVRAAARAQRALGPRTARQVPFLRASCFENASLPPCPRRAQSPLQDSMGDTALRSRNAD